MRRASRGLDSLSRLRSLLIDGVDNLAIDPRATSGQPDGWGWDWERWTRGVR